MGSANRVILMGNLGRAPELRSTSKGRPVVNFSLATNRRYTRADGEVVDETDWHRIVGFGRQAEVCSRYLDRGSPVYVEGRLQNRGWEDAQGQKRVTTEVLLERVALIGGARKQAEVRAAPHAPAAEPPTAAADEELPF